MQAAWTSQQFRRTGYMTIDWVADYLDGVREHPVLSTVKPGEIRDRLPAAPPQQGEAFEELLHDLDTVLLPGITHWNHPRFFAYFTASGSEPGILAETLTAALNVNAMLWRTSPAATELEQLVTSWLGQMIGLGEAWTGHLEDAATTGAILALATARARSPQRDVVVVSEHTHASITRACRLLGLRVRTTPADAQFRLDPARLDLTDACAVVATIGTTSSGASDPLRAIGQACTRADVWLHVDAAYGGSAMICPEMRGLIDGIELADSLVVSPQKWLFVPLGCSVFFTRHSEEVRRAFSLVPEYLRTEETEVANFQEVGLATGRRFRALKLWAVLRSYGREGLQALQREHMRLAELVEQHVHDDPRFALAAPRALSLVCFRLDGSDEENAELMRRVNASGELYISHTKLDGRLVLRFAIGNLRTTEADVEAAWARIDQEARALLAERPVHEHPALPLPTTLAA